MIYTYCEQTISTTALKKIEKEGTSPLNQQSSINFLPANIVFSIHDLSIIDLPFLYVHFLWGIPVQLTPSCRRFYQLALETIGVRLRILDDFKSNQRIWESKGIFDDFCMSHQVGIKHSETAGLGCLP